MSLRCHQRFACGGFECARACVRACLFLCSILSSRRDGFVWNVYSVLVIECCVWGREPLFLSLLDYAVHVCDYITHFTIGVDFAFDSKWIPIFQLLSLSQYLYFSIQPTFLLSLAGFFPSPISFSLSQRFCHFTTSLIPTISYHIQRYIRSLYKCFIPNFFVSKKKEEKENSFFARR